MLSVTREKESGQVLVTPTGVLDEGSVQALLRAVALAPTATALVIDLSNVQIPNAASFRALVSGLASRGGLVLFRRPTWSEAIA
jgi:anti-anti-sigma regulatory factor